MCRAWLALAAALITGAARGQAPTYSAASVVNAANYSPGPFAPNSVVSIFGASLSFSTEGLTVANTSGGFLPLQLANTQVIVDNVPMPLLYVSPGQINFMLPSNRVPGEAKLVVVRQGVRPKDTVSLTVVDAAPAPFQDSAGYAIAQNWNTNYGVITPAAPAQPGDLVILYITGMGVTQPNTQPGEIPRSAAFLAEPGILTILLNGAPVDPNLIKYAGLTPGNAGLYQINFYLPGNTPADPEIRVGMGAQLSAPGLKLAVAAK